MAPFEGIELLETTVLDPQFELQHQLLIVVDEDIDVIGGGRAFSTL
jgi:hypothetical protein